MNRAHARNEAFEPARDVAALAASIVAPLVLYVLTMPRTVVLEDDGLFLMAGAHLGVAHPPDIRSIRSLSISSRNCPLAVPPSSAICPARSWAPSRAVAFIYVDA